MSSSPHRSDALVRFDGAWTDEDRLLVRRAIERLEAPPMTAPASASLAWLCVRHVRESGAFYFAHWLRRPLVLTARTAQELADKIEALRPDTPEP